MGAYRGVYDWDRIYALPGTGAHTDTASMFEIVLEREAGTAEIPGKQQKEVIM